MNLKKEKNPKSKGCHSMLSKPAAGLLRVVIVGTPNVGKSILFNALTGAYVTVSNYPGTTVEVARGKGRLGSMEIEVVDTPGMYRLLPITEEERVARNLLLREKLDGVIHIVDAKNLKRMLPITLQLINAGLPIIMVLNMMDEAERLGIKLDTEKLESILKIPVIPTALAFGHGRSELRDRLFSYMQGRDKKNPTVQPTRIEIPYPEIIRRSLAEISHLLNYDYALSKETIASLLLQNDSDVWSMVKNHDFKSAAEVQKICHRTSAMVNRSISYIMARLENELAEKISIKVMIDPEEVRSTFPERLSRIMINPLTGFPLLIVALFLFYLFVGLFGAQIVVNFLENGIFGRYINPAVDNLLIQIIPWQSIRDLFGGQYGIITLGIRYAIALILPIVGAFFLAFSFLEDSGYLPRLALLVDRAFKKIGLNGRAVIPMALGFGCDTMATVVTRTLETKRERIISTLLLALAVPCSAQLGVLMGMIAGYPKILFIWGILLMGVFLFIGFLSARLMPGSRPSFYIELPPLRFPKMTNILIKTYSRMEWYFREVLPLFILASVLIWIGQLTGLFELIISLLKPLVRWIGLPEETAVAFLFGFFRRDYGAAGLYDLRKMMTGNQLLVAVTTMTLFIPCIAQFSVAIKERGWKTALAMFVFILTFAFLVGGVLFRIITFLGIQL